MTRKRRSATRRPALPASDWLPLPLVLTLAAGMLMLGLFLHRSLGAALLAAAAVGLIGWWWWHHSAYHDRTAARSSGKGRSSRAPRPPRARGAAGRKR